MSPAVTKLLESLQHEPEKWTQDNYAISHKANGVSVWIANGYRFLRFYKPAEASFNMRERSAVDKAIKEWQQKVVYLAFVNGESK